MIKLFGGEINELAMNINIFSLFIFKCERTKKKNQHNLLFGIVNCSILFEEKNIENVSPWAG